MLLSYEKYTWGSFTENLVAPGCDYSLDLLDRIPIQADFINTVFKVVWIFAIVYWTVVGAEPEVDLEYWKDLLQDFVVPGVGSNFIEQIAQAVLLCQKLLDHGRKLGLIEAIVQFLQQRLKYRFIVF